MNSRPICFWLPTGRGLPPTVPPSSSAAAAECGFHLDVICAKVRIIPATGAGFWLIPRPSWQARSPTLVDGKGHLLLDELKPPRISNQIRAALADVKIEPTADEPALSETGARRACRPPSGFMPGTRLKCWRCHRAISTSRPMRFRDARKPCCSSASSSAPGSITSSMWSAAVLHADGFPMVEVRRPEFRGVADRFRQPLGRLDGAVDPADHGKAPAVLPNFGGSLPNDVFSDALGLADDLGAALLSGLLPARARRTYPALGHRGSTRHHGGFVLGFGRNAARPVDCRKSNKRSTKGPGMTRIGAGRVAWNVASDRNARSSPSSSSRSRSEMRWSGMTSPPTAISPSMFRRHFFRTTIPRRSLLLTFGTFGLAFLIRPIGGVVLGAYADRYGRKASLLISIVLMTFGTLTIALMPTYQTIGILAPIAVLIARLVQGFSAGGNSEVRPRFWWSMRRTGEASSRAGSLPARVGRNFLVAVRRRAHHLDDAGRDAVVGLANSVFVRRIGRTGRHLHPQPSRGRDPAARREAGLSGPAGSAATKVSRDAGDRRARDIDRGQLPHRLHADLCGQNPPSVAGRWIYRHFSGGAWWSRS